MISPAEPKAPVFLPDGARSGTVRTLRGLNITGLSPIVQGPVNTIYKLAPEPDFAQRKK
jgi:hypothetical protein